MVHVRPGDDSDRRVTGSPANVGRIRPGWSTSTTWFGTGPSRRRCTAMDGWSCGADGPDSASGQCLLEVGEEVHGVLQADRHAEQSLADTGRRCSSAVRLAWVDVAGWQTSVSGPPSDVAQRAISSRPRNAAAVDRSATSNDSTVPYWRSCLVASIVLRVLRQPGVVDGAHCRDGRRASRRANARSRSAGGCGRRACGYRASAFSASNGDGVAPCSTAVRPDLIEQVAARRR